MTDYLRLVITPEDRERGRTRMIEEAWPVIREHYFGALAKNERATIRITLTAEEPPERPTPETGIQGSGEGGESAAMGRLANRRLKYAPRQPRRWGNPGPFLPRPASVVTTGHARTGNS